jgi:hypothetical protein
MRAILHRSTISAETGALNIVEEKARLEKRGG